MDAVPPAPAAVDVLPALAPLLPEKYVVPLRVTVAFPDEIVTV
jgi:hypothetical protein